MKDTVEQWHTVVFTIFFYNYADLEVTDTLQNEQRQKKISMHKAEIFLTIFIGL